MWQVLVVVCGLYGCDTAAFPTPYATLEECREAGRRAEPAIRALVNAWASRHPGRVRSVTRCDVPPGRA